MNTREKNKHFLIGCVSRREGTVGLIDNLIRTPSEAFPAFHSLNPIHIARHMNVTKESIETIVEVLNHQVVYSEQMDSAIRSVYKALQKRYSKTKANIIYRRLKNYIHNRDYMHDATFTASLREVFLMGFVWRYTREGHTYWSNIFTSIGGKW